MAQRQVYGRIPGTNRMGWRYIDVGERAAGKGGSRPLVQTFVMGDQRGTGTGTGNGGGKRKRLKGLGS